MRFNLTTFLVFLAFLSGWCQEYKIDSLKRLIQIEGETGRKVELLNTLSFIYFDGDIELADETTEQALSLAKKINDKEGEGWAFAYRGLYFFFSGRLTLAQEQFERSFTSARNLNNVNLEIYSLTQLGNILRDRGAFDSAMYFYKKAEQTFKRKPSKHYQSVVRMNQGRFFLIIDKPDSALIKIKEALELRKDEKDSALIAGSWILLGNCYRNKYDLAKAEYYYEKARHAAPTNGALYNDYLQNMGEVYFTRGDFQAALKNWTEALSYHRKAHYKYTLAFLLFRLGVALEEQGYYDLAQEYLSNALKIAERAEYGYLIAEINYALAWVYYRSNSLELAIKSINQAESDYRKLKLALGMAGCLNVKGLILMK